MKVIRILGHPVTVLSLFGFVIIEGEHFGGFYLLYLLMGLMYGAGFAISAVVGGALMIASLNLSTKYGRTKPWLYLIAWCLLIFSYLLFFGNHQNNHHETIESSVPVASFVLFAFCSLCFFINLFSMLRSNFRKREGELTAI